MSTDFNPYRVHDLEMLDKMIAEEDDPNVRFHLIKRRVHIAATLAAHGEIDISPETKYTYYANKDET